MENGLLSMWRGYGRDGVALVFDRSELEACLGQELGQFKYTGCQELLDVVYSVDGGTFEGRFGKFASLLHDDARRYLIEHQHGEDFLRLLLGAAAAYRHHAFREEREVRIVLYPDSPPRENDDGSNYKEIKADRRYVEIFGGAEMLPITKVIVGPQLDQDERVSRAKEILRKYPKVQIGRSQTPYRPG